MPDTQVYVYYTTLTETLHKSTASSMQSNNVVQQSSLNAMKINGRKTNELLLGPITKDMPPPLILDGATVERVTSFKLLGVHVSNDLKWAQHINAISSKAASHEDLLYFYCPILEHASPVWHLSG